MKQVHKLGSAQGKMIENGDGTVSYRPFGKPYPSWKVRISEVDHVVWEGVGISSCSISVVGIDGRVLAKFVGPGLSAQRVDEWFRAHPAYRGTGTSGLVG